ncbi:MAG: MASE1 domain-containing protein [Lysobacteraceae bacterium]
MVELQSPPSSTTRPRPRSDDGLPRLLLVPWLWAPLYTLLWVVGYQVSSYYWFLPAGLRIGCLLLAPRRFWPWLLVGEGLAIFWLYLDGHLVYKSWLAAFLVNGPPWVIGAIVVAAGWRQGARPTSPAAMLRLLLMCLVAASLVSPLLTFSQYVDGVLSRESIPERAVGMAVGDFVSMLIAAPGLMMLADLRSLAEWREMLLRCVMPILLPLAACALAAWVWPKVSGYLLVLALTPTMVTAFRYGWRGAAAALLVTSFGIYAIGELGEVAIDRALMQLIVAVFGSGTLMLGAAVDSIRASNAELAENVRALSEANQQLRDQSSELSELSRRLVRVQEEEQQRIAGELQDELGQSMSTMGVRLGLASRQSRDPEMLAVVDAMREMVRDLHTTIRSVVSRLAPTPPKAEGLVSALRDGILGHLLEEAGIDAAYRIDSRLEALGDGQRTLLFRMCQEAVTDAIRSGQVSSLKLQITLPDSVPQSVCFRVEQTFSEAVPYQVGVRKRDFSSEHRGIRDRVRGADGSYQRWEEQGVAVAEARMPARLREPDNADSAPGS